MDTMTAKKKPSQFGPTFNGNYPSEMRTQLWPLCCGARIISGFKHAANLTLEDLVEEIEATLKAVPDFQVFQGEQMQPKLTMLTLNAGQMGSAKIMQAVEKCGFQLVFTAHPRGSKQGFFVRDETNTLQLNPDAGAKAA